MFENENLGEILMHFYKRKKDWLLQENNLLVSRWNRFCKTSFDASKYAHIFKKREGELRLEYRDASHRYEKLYESHSTVNQRNRECLV